jgi:hypothetical protein
LREKYESNMWRVRTAGTDAGTYCGYETSSCHHVPQTIEMAAARTYPQRGLAHPDEIRVT